MHTFFLRELQLITVLFLICNFHTSWSPTFISLKLCVGFSIFDSISFWLKFILFFNKSMDSIMKNQTIMVIKLWDFLMFYQIFLSPQVKQSASNKQGVYELLHELPNDLKRRILWNKGKSGKCQNLLEW